jgi:hypothetical protein
LKNLIGSNAKRGTQATVVSIKGQGDHLIFFKNSKIAPSHSKLWVKKCKGGIHRITGKVKAIALLFAVISPL